jgi:hypothetical protein
MNTFFRHIGWIIQYGEWSYGWEDYKNKPRFGFHYVYYDGHALSFHFFKFWLMVEY